MEILTEIALATGAVLANIVVASIIGFGLYKIGLFSDIGSLPNSTLRWGRAVAILAALNFMVSGFGKVIAFSPMVEKFTLFNMMHLFTFVGITEIIIGFVLIFPKTYKIGLLFGTAMAGGAVATHLPEHSDGIIWAIPSGTFMVVLWLSAVLYTPEVFPDYVSKLFHKDKQAPA